MSILVNRIKSIEEIDGFPVVLGLLGERVTLARFPVSDLESVYSDEALELTNKLLTYSNKIGVQVIIKKEKLGKEVLSPYEYKRKQPELFGTWVYVAVSCNNKQINEIISIFTSSNVDPLTKDSLGKIFRERNQKTSYYTSDHIYDGERYSKYFYLTKQKVLNRDSIALFLEKMNLSCEVTVNLSSLSPIESEKLINQNIRESASNSSSTSSEDINSFDTMAKDVLRKSNSHIRAEWIFSVSSKNLKELDDSTSNIKYLMRSLGDVQYEYCRAKRPYLATRFGSYPDLYFYESLENGLEYILPTKAYGNSVASPKGGDLSLLRRDKSILQFDRFSPKYKAANTLVIGSTGSGKGVFVNSEIAAVMKREDVELIIADIGGTYSNLTESLSGKSINYSENSSFGIDPFYYFNERDKYKDFIHTNVRFVKDLLSGNNADLDSKSAYLVEKTVKEYASVDRESYSFHDYVEFYSKEFQYPEYLDRWGKTGVYGKLITHIPGPENKITYFNLVNVMSSANSEVSKICFSLLMCFYSIKVIREGEIGKRVVLILDEVKELLKLCKETIVMVHANARKLGHSMTLIDQTSLRIAEVSKEIFVNSDIHILFNIAGTKEEIMEWHKISTNQYERIVSRMDLEEGKHSFFVNSDKSLIEAKIELDLEAYWRVNTNKVDRDRLRKVMDLLPGVPKEKVIECLSFS